MGNMLGEERGHLARPQRAGAPWRQSPSLRSLAQGPRGDEWHILPWEGGNTTPHLKGVKMKWEHVWQWSGCVSGCNRGWNISNKFTLMHGICKAEAKQDLGTNSVLLLRFRADERLLSSWVNLPKLHSLLIDEVGRCFSLPFWWIWEQFLGSSLVPAAFPCTSL